KGPEVRFISHLDLMRLWQRAIRCSGLPVAYSQGFSPHQKLSFGPPLALGYSSVAEHLDIQLERPAGEDITAVLNRHLAPGVRALDCRPVFRDASSIVQLAGVAEYRVGMPGTGADPGAVLASFRDRMAKDGPWPVTVTRKQLARALDIKPQLRGLRAEGDRLVFTVNLVEGGAKFHDIAAAVLGLDAAGAARLAVERTGLYHADGAQLIPLMDRSLL
ncbi:DUF2344 domain-containing protein, partial [bacterium]|nr:DUF2344 domain-containing protein [bacterium]